MTNNYPGLKTPTGKSQPVGYLQACLRIWIPDDRGTNPASGGIGKTPTQDLLAILPSQFDTSITEPQQQFIPELIVAIYQYHERQKTDNTSLFFKIFVIGFPSVLDKLNFFFVS